MIADAAKSERARNIVLRRQTEFAFTGPLGLVARAKCFPVRTSHAASEVLRPSRYYMRDRALREAQD
jgi:hypothetical protein